MAIPSVVSEQRKSPRVQLNLPVRLRWQGALGHALEVTETLDVSRGGLLFYRTAPMPLNARVWVTYPYDAQNAAGQPETPAHVVRVKTTPGGGQLVAVEFEAPRRSVTSVGSFNRRVAPRTPMALPLSVRLPDVPWPEESMTVDLSDTGMLIRTPHQYAVGDVVRVALSYGTWARKGEFEARVVRVEPIGDSVEQRVALALVPV